MRTFHDIPDHVLHEVLSVTIDSTRSKGWQLSLRLVNRKCQGILIGSRSYHFPGADQFNEAVLHVYYLQKRLVADTGAHSRDCINPCYHRFCRKHATSRTKEAYAARFSFQSLLTSRDLTSVTTEVHQLLRQWKEALVILRRGEGLRLLSIDQGRFYSTCSDNPIFNDAPSAILSEAITSYMGPTFLAMLLPRDWNYPTTGPSGLQIHTPPFWLALCACVLGDQQSLDSYMNKLSSIEEASTLEPPDLLIAEQGALCWKWQSSMRDLTLSVIYSKNIPT